MLPLHQYLDLQRKKLKKKDNTDGIDTAATLMLGEVDPIHYIDPFLNTLFKEPVKLLTSNQIVEKSVALQYFRQSGRDPFNNKILTMKQIIPQTDLQKEIEQYKINKSLKYEKVINLTTQDVKPLIEENGNFDPELLKAIVDVERLEHVIQQSEFEASKDSNVYTKKLNIVSSLNDGDDVTESMNAVETGNTNQY